MRFGPFCLLCRFAQKRVVLSKRLSLSHWPKRSKTSGFRVSRTTIIRSCVISLCKTMQDHSAIPFLGVKWVQAQGCVSRLVRCAGNALGSLAALHVHTVPRWSFEVGKNLFHSLGSTILMESTWDPWAVALRGLADIWSNYLTSYQTTIQFWCEAWRSLVRSCAP